ncbi:MAG: spore germination protein GerW family protein [Thermoleophilia bacterium]|nr:spore germination protein GerW family protein [Thermoleophilia bacterium]MDH4346813.1 spore germination protein GerW family protein [Thermoleophilia bacterium]MDH5332734.1 spore germination protein GerW family protein [Thermoleophilia bacterium]
MNVGKLMRGVQDALSARRVYGDPIERDGALVIPVAALRGGGGGGGDEQGSGGGLGVDARPVGVFVVGQEGVSFEPAVDVTRLVTRVLLLAALVAFLWRPRR